MSVIQRCQLKWVTKMGFWVNYWLQVGWLSSFMPSHSSEKGQLGAAPNVHFRPILLKNSDSRGCRNSYEFRLNGRCRIRSHLHVSESCLSETSRAAQRPFEWTIPNWL